MTGAQPVIPTWDPNAWRAYFRRYRRFRWQLVAAATLSVLQSLSLLPIAWLIKISFDRISAHSGFYPLFWSALGILCLVLASSGFSLLARYHSLKTTKLVIQDIRLELLNKGYALADTFAFATDRSWLHTAIVQDTERIDVGSNAVVVVALPALVTSSIFLIILAVLAPALLLATLAVAPLAYVGNRVLGRRLRHLVGQFRLDFERFDENISAGLRRTELTRLRGAQAHEIATQAIQIDILRRISGRMAWVGTAYSVVQSSVARIAGLTTLVVGGTAVGLGWMTISGLAAYYFMLAQMSSSMNALSSTIPQIFTGVESLNNVTRILCRTPHTPPGGTLAHRVTGAVDISGVHFRYGDHVVFQGIDLQIAAGESVAIIGPNGSGKTTLCYLLLGLYAPERGQIQIDGVPLASLSLNDMRRQIGVVLQDPLIFAGSIAQNIAYGMETASRLDIENAARLGGAHGFIQSLPQGYDTLIGQSGCVPSGGQNQLLALARALLSNPRILILDEPTNHLDDQATADLFINLERIVPKPTIILITHDIHLARRMSRIYALADGELCEDGNDGPTIRSSQLI